MLNEHLHTSYNILQHLITLSTITWCFPSIFPTIPGGLWFHSINPRLKSSRVTTCPASRASSDLPLPTANLWSFFKASKPKAGGGGGRPERNIDTGTLKVLDPPLSIYARQVRSLCEKKHLNYREYLFVGIVQIVSGSIFEDPFWRPL